MSESTVPEAGVSVRPPRENLYRINPDIGLTRATDDAMPTMTGHFAVWNQWTEIRSAYEGNFMERFAPGAMTKTLSEQTPKVLFQHGKDPQVGDKVLGPISRVEPDSTGAYYEVPLLDTSYNRDLIPGLQAGLYGASFRFSVIQEDVTQKPKRSEFNPRGIPERTVTEAKVMEFGPVTFPAYAGASAGIRSITDEFLIDQFLADKDIVERLAAAVAEKSRTFTVSFNGTTVTSGIGAGLAEASANFPGGAALVAEIAEPDGSANRAENEEPEPPEATTPEEPELPVATTPLTNRGLFWFTEDPKLKGATK